MSREEGGGHRHRLALVCYMSMYAVVVTRVEMERG